MTSSRHDRLKQLGWFAAFWAAGVLGVSLLGLLIKLLLAL